MALSDRVTVNRETAELALSMMVEAEGQISGMQIPMSEAAAAIEACEQISVAKADLQAALDA
jgi:hypothetical protein